MVCCHLLWRVTSLGSTLVMGLNPGSGFVDRFQYFTTTGRLWPKLSMDVLDNLTCVSDIHWLIIAKTALASAVEARASNLQYFKAGFLFCDRLYKRNISLWPWYWPLHFYPGLKDLLWYWLTDEAEAWHAGSFLWRHLMLFKSMSSFLYKYIKNKILH